MEETRSVLCHTLLHNICKSKSFPCYKYVITGEGKQIPADGKLYFFAIASSHSICAFSRCRASSIFDAILPTSENPQILLGLHKLRTQNGLLEWSTKQDELTALSYKFAQNRMLDSTQTVNCGMRVDGA